MAIILVYKKLEKNGRKVEKILKNHTVVGVRSHFVNYLVGVMQGICFEVFFIVFSIA